MLALAVITAGKYAYDFFLGDDYGPMTQDSEYATLAPMEDKTKQGPEKETPTDSGNSQEETQPSGNIPVKPASIYDSVPFSFDNIDHAGYKKRNKDYDGFLNIPGTAVSYPVVFPEKDNSEYLHKSFDGKYSFPGTMFIDRFALNMVNEENLIIYGHNMVTEKMFGGLYRFKDKDYFDSHQYIEFYTENWRKVYLVFSVRYGGADMDDKDYVLTGFDRQDYINYAAGKSVQKRDIDLSSPDFSGKQPQIITLYTCTSDKNKKLLVSAVEVKSEYTKHSG